MFLNEVRMCFEAKHRNIVLILDFNVGGVYRTADGKVRRILYYVMRIAQNGELFRILTLTDPFSEKIARYIFRQLVIALRHLHNRRIAHCDLKSENVLIDSKLNLKIADFGYARYHVDSSCNKILYDAHEPVGTVKCNAPELIGQLNVHNEYQADSLDLFACGCLLFEIVMKAQPFRTAETKDDHYSKLTNDKKKFWEIYATKYSPTPDFKGSLTVMQI